MWKRWELVLVVFMVGCPPTEGVTPVDPEDGGYDAPMDSSVQMMADAAVTAMDAGVEVDAGSDAGTNDGSDAATDAQTDSGPDACASNPCMNGGTCSIHPESGYLCTCATGFTGTNCETNINDCSPNPCMHGGTCTDAIASFTCSCIDGYFGTDCSTNPPNLSINWDDSATLLSSVAAGYAPVSNWNSASGDGPGQGDNGTKSALVDSSGNATGVGVTWQGQDIEATTITGGSAGDQTMMAEGVRSWQGHGDASITLTGLAAQYPAGYRVIVYVGRGGGYPPTHSASFNLTVGTDSITGHVMPSFDGTWDLLTGGDDAGNYYLSTPQTTDTLAITIAATGSATLPTAAINGLSLIPISE